MAAHNPDSSPSHLDTSPCAVATKTLFLFLQDCTHMGTLTIVSWSPNTARFWNKLLWRKKRPGTHGLCFSRLKVTLGGCFSELHFSSGNVMFCVFWDAIDWFHLRKCANDRCQCHPSTLVSFFTSPRQYSIINALIYVVLLPSNLCIHRNRHFHHARIAIG